VDPVSEADRLRAVYRAYASDARKRAAWSLRNAGNRAIFTERNRRIQLMLGRFHYLPLAGRRILDVGCGYGHVLAEFLAWGAEPADLYGVDLNGDRIEHAKEQYPALHFNQANAASLDLASGLFDLVLLFTVFSSILDREMQSQVASEAARVLRTGGAIVWYDFRYDNPSNPNVRGLRRHDVQRLFPGFQLSLQTITLLPPLARRLGRYTRVLYALMSRLPFLRTHYVGFLIKP
jgi:SAM-dependent methyltransferase